MRQDVKVYFLDGSIETFLVLLLCQTVEEATSISTKVNIESDIYIQFIYVYILLSGNDKLPVANNKKCHLHHHHHHGELCISFIF